MAVYHNGQRVSLERLRGTAKFMIDLADNTIGYVTSENLASFEAVVKSMVNSAAAHRAMAEGNLWI